MLKQAKTTVDFLFDLFRTLLDGNGSTIADIVERLLGRPTRTVGSYARRSRGAWAA